VDKPVLTGQQIGLLGGPLYTTYKVLGAIHYSNTINGTPVYWLETNDADFNEINTIHFLDRDNSLRSLTWDIDSQGFSCGFVETDKTLLSLFDTFFSSIKQTSHTDALQEMVTECYFPGQPLGTASMKFAEKLFGWSNIRLFNPSEKEFLLSIRPVLKAEAVSTEDGNQCHFFYIDGKKRKAVYKKNGEFYSREGDPIDLDQFPLTPNVKTRNVCQDAYFHTHTYIAGPGEIHYIAELDPVYKRHSVKKPAIKKRMSIDLIEPRTNRLLHQCSLSPRDITSYPKDICAKHILQRETGFDYNELKRKALDHTDDYLGTLDSLHIETSGLRRMLTGEIKTLIGKKRALEKAKLDTTMEKVHELSDRLLPFDRKQERIFNILYYMNLYGGLDFIQWLYNHYSFTIQTLEIRYD
jgi:bacillithiol synthase